MFSEIMFMLIGIFFITTAALGLDCYKEDSARRKFMIAMIVMGVFTFLMGMVLLIQSSRSQGVTNALKAVRSGGAPRTNLNVQ